MRPNRHGYTAQMTEAAVLCRMPASGDIVAMHSIALLQLTCISAAAAAAVQHTSSRNEMLLKHESCKLH
jgi:hypothetical protein